MFSWDLTLVIDLGGRFGRLKKVYVLLSCFWIFKQSGPGRSFCICSVMYSIMAVASGGLQIF